MKKSFFLPMVMIMFLFLGASCTTYHFGVPAKAMGVPAEFGETEVAIAKAEQSQGAKYCPEKIARARELAKKGVETYWACRTEEGLRLLADARQLAAEAEGCRQPPPPPPAPARPAPPPPPPPMEKDSDNDGVPDSRDKCPGTPAGVKVDKDGCPLDSDRDGVPDYLDKCPGTPVGVTVNKDGCPPPPKVIDKLTLQILFDTDRATITEAGQRELQKAVAFVKKYSGAKIEVDGHTDSVGPEAYNMKLSEKRAAAVKDYLIKEAGVSSSKIAAIGFGEAKPVADNKTAAGRAQNRRVEILILSD